MRRHGRRWSVGLRAFSRNLTRSRHLGLQLRALHEFDAIADAHARTVWARGTSGDECAK
jgi:hypothetical protein